ncbi:MAG: UvrD-helicase domain-containing protein [Clostridia bacterium]|nr:UvrD-helicase domain-containing protein [Clostridia bacterium]
MGIFSQKETKEFNDLKSFFEKISELLNTDKYISKKDFLVFADSSNESYESLTLMDEKNVLSVWCKQNRIDIKTIKKYLDAYKSIELKVKEHNDLYVKDHLKTDKDYLDKILIKDDPHILLDEEQRRVVLSDEDYTLVIAGAGAGKTTTIEAKVKYLIDKQNISPDRVLIVSFTKKATEELKERFGKLEIPVNIATFHSIGNTLIKENDGERHQIVDQGFMYNAIKDYLCNKLDDEYFVKKILLFFASYLNMPFDSQDTTLLFKTLSANDVTTLKSDLANLLDDYQKEQTKKMITINDERVRSVDECRIANFLFIKGIDYVYEPIYRYGFEDTTKPYCPDFLIKYNDQEIYLEHFGVSEDGKNNRFSEEEVEEYKKHINDKILLHRKHGTKLIYTFSKYNDGRDVITHLEEKLLELGIKFDAKDNMDIYRKLAKNAEDKYFNKFIMLVCNFINRFKVCNYDPDTKFDEWLYNVKNERTKLFLEITKRCLHIYEAKRLEAKAIDFEDMINNASNVLDKRIKENNPLPYDYILVDEYQDISLQRFDLCERLSKASNAKIIAVGDDWQSIFRFSGAQIDLFTKFEEKMGYANILKITKTYRNSQELIDIAGGFVMENQKQIRKDLKSNKSIKDPVILMSYNDSYDKDDKEHGPFYRLGEAIEKSLDDIVAKNGEDKTVLLIGRYNFDGKNLSTLEDFFTWENNQLKSKKYPKLDITFMTAHASKGLGRDNVIIINGKDDVLGFPSKIEDDPVMKLVIKDDESMDFEEERRLFYVALTRTKNRVYIVTPQLRPSKFILEIQKKFTRVILQGVELNPQEDTKNKHVCPCCGYPLQKRKSNFKFLNATKTLWICSNDPEVCGFMTNDLKGGKLSISKCPDCEDGYLIVKPVRDKDGSDTGERMLGCTNYKKDGTGCNFNMLNRNYTQDKTKILKTDDGRIMRDNFKSVILNVFNSIKEIHTRNTKFRFSVKALADYLNGEDTKIIQTFKLNDIGGAYGIFKEKSSYVSFKFINTMIETEILKKVKNGSYENLEINVDSVSDELIVKFSKIYKEGK